MQTLRYYERRGLLDEPDRTLGGHRLYRPEAVTVLRVIKAAQRLGFTLNEVAFPSLQTRCSHSTGRSSSCAGLRGQSVVARGNRGGDQRRRKQQQVRGADQRLVHENSIDEPARRRRSNEDVGENRDAGKALAIGQRT